MDQMGKPFGSILVRELAKYSLWMNGVGNHSIPSPTFQYYGATSIVQGQSSEMRYHSTCLRGTKGTDHYGGSLQRNRSGRPN
jgi:hypothetical protein